jgi:hypothetical protein
MNQQPSDEGILFPGWVPGKEDERLTRVGGTSTGVSGAGGAGAGGAGAEGAGAEGAGAEGAGGGAGGTGGTPLERATATVEGVEGGLPAAVALATPSKRTTLTGGRRP